VITTPPLGEAPTIVMSVCLSVSERICGTTRSIYTKYFMHVTYVRGSVVLWRRRDMSCISGFMDDVITAHIGHMQSDGETLGGTSSQPAWLGRG